MKFGTLTTSCRGGRLCPPDCIAEYFDYLAGVSNTHLHRVFCWLEIRFAQANPWEKSKKGGRNPLLGRFKGDCKGARAPARIQRSDSRGKRRNNETDETCRLRRGEGCVVCSDVNPPLPFFLSTVNGAFFLMLRKKAGLKNLLRPPDAVTSAPVARFAPSRAHKEPRALCARGML